MEALNAAALEALLDLLVGSGVEEFEGYGIHVRFTEQMFTPDKQVAQNHVAEVEPVPVTPKTETMNPWEDESLWAGGKRPEFPGSKR